MADAAATEPRGERATVTVTRTEKAALQLVSLLDEVSESDLLRDRTIAEVVERAAHLRARTVDAGAA